MIDYYLTQSKVLKQSGFTWKTDWEFHKGDHWVLPPSSRNAQKLFLFSARGQHDQSNHKQHRGKWGNFHDTIPRLQSKQLCPYFMAHRSILPSICSKQIRLLLNQVIHCILSKFISRCMRNPCDLFTTLNEKGAK